MNLINRLELIFTSKTNQDLAEKYAQWAKDYEQDLEVYGVLLSDSSLCFEELLKKYLNNLPKNAKILDVGAGTGLIGQMLQQLGYTNLSAIDLSEKMLAEARKKGVYTSLQRMVLGETLDFPTASFDCVTGFAVFAERHAPSSSFEELIRITKPGGYIIFTLAPDFYQNSDFKEKLPALEEAGKWELVEVGEKYPLVPTNQPQLSKVYTSEAYVQNWVYRVKGVD